MITKLANDYSTLTDQELDAVAGKSAAQGFAGMSLGFGGAAGSAIAAPNAAIGITDSYRAAQGKRGQKLMSAMKANKGALGAAAGTVGLGALGLATAKPAIDRLRSIETEVHANRPHLLSQPE